MNFKITAPIGGTFSVVIKNSSDVTVYTDTHGNEEFDPGITTPGSYILYINDNEGYCFDIPECECPTLLNASIVLGGMTYTAKFLFEYLDVSTFCPFTIFIRTDFTGGMFVPLYINSISDLTPTGDPNEYIRNVILGGVGFMEYKIVPQGTETICSSGTVTYDCVPPTIESVDLGYSDELGYFLKVIATECGCGSYTMNFVQTFPASGYSGGASRTIDCEDLPDTFILPITPTPDAAGTVNMTVTISDCCRGTTEYLLSVTPPCDGPSLTFVPPFGILFKYTNTPSPRIVYEVLGGTCSGDCTTATITYTQINEGIIGAPDSGTISGYNLCAQNYFPLTSLTPNTSYPGYTPTGANQPKYAVTVTTCCGAVFSDVSG